MGNKQTKQNKKKTGNDEIKKLYSLRQNANRVFIQD